MAITELVGILIAVPMFFKARSFSQQFRLAKEGDRDGVRDALVIMKNRLFLEGVALFLLVVVFAAASDGWSRRGLALLPVAAAGVLFYFRPRRKLEEQLAARGNTPEQIRLLSLSSRFYTLALAGAALAVLTTMVTR